MKILLTYPPLDNKKGIPLLSQNRQFQYFKEPTYIYPVVPASAATLLKEAGHEVIWLDCIAGGISYNSFIEIIKQENPDLIALETKTPVIKQHWKIINDIKGLSPHKLGTVPANSYGTASVGTITDLYKGDCPAKSQGTVPLVVLFGDHVTALPEESFQNSQIDFVLTGGDYDFLLLNLCNYLSQKGLSPQTVTGHPSSELYLSLTKKTVPPNLKGTVPDIEELEPGIYYRNQAEIKNTGNFKLNHDLNTLLFIDRDLTKWQLYAYNNGNYKRTPGTYIMSGRDCWYHQCTFCSWPTLYPEFRTRSVKNVLDEIGVLIDKYNIREVMDDTGTFPAGEWLRDFCKGMIEMDYQKKIYLDCNMRFGALSKEDLSLMKKANFRLLLFGLESANQKTLDRLNKNLKVETIIEDCKLATKAGLFPHITIMFGYPWESYAEALKTLNLGRWLLKKGYAYTMQATVVISYPGSPLFAECKENNWLKTFNWDDYDMKQPVMQSPIPDSKIMGLVQEMYKVSFQPQFALRKIFSIRDADDLRYALRAAKKVTGHILDFKKGQSLPVRQAGPSGKALN